jgi:hypothetical protein
MCEIGIKMLKIFFKFCYYSSLRLAFSLIEQTFTTRADEKVQTFL